MPRWRPLTARKALPTVRQFWRALVSASTRMSHRSPGARFMRLVRIGQVRMRRFTVVPHILEWVKRGAHVATDTAGAFCSLPEEGYWHGTVNYSVGEYVKGPVHT